MEQILNNAFVLFRAYATIALAVAVVLALIIIALWVYELVEAGKPKSTHYWKGKRFK